MNQPKVVIPQTIKILIMVFLVGVLLFVMTWTNTIPCKTIPGWCDVYYGLKGNIASGTWFSLDYKPRVAIVYGYDGLGNPQLLQQMMMDRTHFKFGAKPAMINMDFLNLGNLKMYDLVIVEKARTMPTEKMQMFVDYVIQGGRLIWIGDAGAVLPQVDDLLYEDELNSDAPGAMHVPIGPWARKHLGKVVLLNEILGVNYLTNYCTIKPCTSDVEMCPGVMVAADSKNPFTYALSPSLPFCIIPSLDSSTDFALVFSMQGKVSTNALSLDFGGSIIDAQGNNYGKVVPLIVTTSKANILGFEVGKNVAYYALPPEFFAYDYLSDNHKYYSLLENMYWGMLYG